MRLSDVVKVDRFRCVSAGQCIIRAAHLFNHDGEGYVLIGEEDVELTPDDLYDARSAVMHCPSGALSLAHSELPGSD